MNTEQERESFETWAEQRGMELHKVSPCDGRPPYYADTPGMVAWEAWQARAALQSQDREAAELVEILREAAEIIAAVPTDYAPENLRGPIVDELEGFALMLDHARRAEGET